MFGSRKPSPPPPYTTRPGARESAASPLLQNFARESERNDPPPNYIADNTRTYGSFANNETRRPHSSTTPKPTSTSDGNGANDDTSIDSISIKSRVLFVLLSIAAICLLSFSTFFKQRDAGANPAPRFSWTQLADGNCVRRATRESYARLVGSHPLTSACKSTPRAMNGTTLYPSRCTHAIWSEYGYWDTTDELECVPYWTSVQSTACVAYETRRWTARLENIHYDSRRACQEAPITLPTGDTYFSPSKCSSQWNGQIIGEWLRRDSGDYECIPFWTNIKAGRCLAYGVRDYKAQLSNVNYNPWLACHDTPIKDQDVPFGPPLSCIPTRDSMEGRWNVHGQSHCMPHWGKLKRNGCVRRGFRRFSSRLWGIHDADWRTMCRTTPIDIASYHFEHTEGCTNHWVGGMWGYWYVPDDSCA